MCVTEGSLSMTPILRLRVNCRPRPALVHIVGEGHTRRDDACYTRHRGIPREKNHSANATARTTATRMSHRDAKRTGLPVVAPSFSKIALASLASRGLRMQMRIV